MLGFGASGFSLHVWSVWRSRPPPMAGGGAGVCEGSGSLELQPGWQGSQTRPGSHGSPPQPIKL